MERMIAKRILIVLIPSLLFSIYCFVIGNPLEGMLALAIATGISMFFRYMSGKGVPTRIDRPLVTLILHLYTLSLGEVGPEDLIAAVADTKEYGFYSQVFRKIRNLAKDFGYGFTKATAQIAHTMKSPLREILVRFTTIFSSVKPEGYLKIEASTSMVEYSGYYERAIESLKMVGGVYTAFQSVIIFMVMTLAIMTVFAVSADMVVYAYIVAAIALVVIYTIIRISAPSEKIVHLGEFPPRSYRAMKWSLLVTVPVSALVAFMLYFSYGEAFSFLALGMGMIIPGILAYKVESYVDSIDRNYPTFLKALGENLASTSDLKSALRYILYMELGPLKKLVQKALARLNLGLSHDKTMSTLSSETGSYKAYVSNRIFLDALNRGGDPLKIGNILGNRVVKFLEFRKKRLTMANGFQITLLVIQPITVVLLVVLTTLSRFLSQYMSVMPAFGFAPVPMGVVEIGNVILVILTTILNALALKEMKGSFLGTFLLNLGLLLILSGAAWIATTELVDMMLGQLPSLEFPIPTA